LKLNVFWVTFGVVVFGSDTENCPLPDEGRMQHPDAGARHCKIKLQI
jgi:hypothetical protein